MKRIVALALSVLMLTSTIFLCSCKKKENTLVMATNAAFPPYEFVENGKYAGIDVEIAEKIAEKLGMTLKIEDVDFGAIIGGVQTGKYDMGMAGITVDEDRKKNVDFTDTYAKGVQVIIVKEGSEYASTDDFFVLDENGNRLSVKEGVKIGVQQDTTGDIYSSDEIKNGGFGNDTILRYKNGADAVQALISGKCEAVIIDNEPAKSFVSANEGLKILESTYVDEEYAICVSKKNKELLEKINKALNELKADGTIDKIVAKYINDDSNDTSADESK